MISSPVAVSVPAQEAKVAPAAPVPAQETKVAPAASVPAQETKVAAVAPTNPDEPAHSALGMRTLATPSSANGSRVAIHLIEADAVGGLVAKGSAEPNAKVRLYLNQADLAEANTQSDGHWSFTIQHGMSPGGYVMRADEMSASGASVVASAEAPFVYPEAPSPAPTASALASAIRRAIVRALAGGPGGRIGSNQARRHGPHFMGSQPKLLWRPDALPGDRRREPKANPQSQPHLSRRGVRRSEVGRKTISDAMQDRRDDTPPELWHRTFDDPLGRRIVDMHIWAVREGLRGADAYRLFDGYCQRLVIDGVQLWRAQAAMETLHPQWNGYGYTWRRDLNAIEPENYAHSEENDRVLAASPFYVLMQRARAGENTPALRRRIETGSQERDFPILQEFHARGATDYFAQIFVYGEMGDRSQGTGIAYSFATDRKGGFSDDDTTLVQATLPALSLAMKAHAGHVIASGLLGAYLGEDAGRRVHTGSIMRGSFDTLRAVLWYADIRGFTPLSDAAPGPVVVELLNDVFEILTAPLRERGGHVLKFIGDAMLAIFPFEDADRAETCRRALDAAIEAMRAIEALSAARIATASPVAPVDLALHLGEALYGNVGAIDRLDFTVIGPAINEVTRIEALCQPLGRAVLVSAEFVAGMKAPDGRLKSLGRHALRGVKEPKEIFALDLSASGRDG